MTQKVKVSDLKAGDILGGCKIIQGPFDSCRCPKGKTNLIVEYKNPIGEYSGGPERRQRVQWNKSTIVGIQTPKVNETVA